jgi:hypothetical protein
MGQDFYDGHALRYEFMMVVPQLFYSRVKQFLGVGHQRTRSQLVNISVKI